MGRNGLWVRHRSKRPRCTSSLEASPATGVSEHGVSEHQGEAARDAQAGEEIRQGRGQAEAQPRDRT